ncbi:DUF1934 domain-containing protein [Brevibacillus dissolubilis]|uniref:DUF1934 domain-containing protein n=1 Tax=Brevibacillus dissolubilis TaxID=1844116 RepID=UPI001117048C|nr:DUF1934 domain-containing protein [Brevibacillus dissolubilis]
MQEVTLHVRIKQTADGRTDETKQTHEGKGTAKGNGWYFTYKEELEEAGSVNTVYKIEDGMVSLIRQGQLQMKQLFVKGRTSESVYHSPYGMFEMETHTSKLSVKSEGERPERISIAYQLWMNKQYVGSFELELQAEWND